MRKLCLLFCVTIVAVLIALPAASQQMPAGVRAKIDSGFVVGNMHLPAGEYVFAVDSFTSRMRISNVATLETVFVNVQERIDNSTSDPAKLAFANDKDELFLHKVWQGGHVYDIMHGTEMVELK